MAQPLPSYFRKHRLLSITLLILAGILLLVSISVPLIVEWQLKSFLKQNGERNVQIEGVSFNVFTFKLTVHTLLAEEPQKGKLQWKKFSLNINVWPLTQKKLLIENLELQNATITIVQMQNGTIAAGGIKLPKSPPKPAEKPQWQLGIENIKLSNVQLKYSSPNLVQDFLIVNASIDTFVNWLPNASTNFSIKVKIDSGVIQSSGSLKPLTNQRSINALLQADTVPFSWISPLLAQQSIKILNGTFSSKLLLDGSIPMTASSFLGKISGSASIQNIRTEDLRHDINLQKIAWSGDATAGQNKSISINGSINLSLLNVSDVIAGLHLLSLDSMAIDGISLSSKRIINLHTLSLSNINALRPLKSPDLPPVVAIKNITAENGIINAPSMLHFDNIRISALNGVITRRADSTIDVIQYLSAITQKKAPSKKAARPITMSINNITVNDNTSLNFSDFTLKPPLRLLLNTIQLTIGNLTNLPGKDTSTVMLNGAFNKFSSLTLTGTAQPFTPFATTNLHGNLKGFLLPQMSGYVEDLAGYSVQSGRLNSNAAVNITKGASNSVIDLTIEELRLKPQPKSPAYRSFRNKFLISLPTSLSILKNADGDIKLSIPVKGTVNNPDVKFGNIIKTAMSNAFQTSITGTFGALGAALAGNNDSNLLSFKAIVFKPLSTTLSGDNKQYLDQFAKELRKHNDLRILVCGKAASSEKGTAIGVKTQDLLNLASRRSSAVKSYLISQGKIHADRIYLCKPAIDSAKAADPRVDISI